jgi:hypothetical protein
LMECLSSQSVLLARGHHKRYAPPLFHIYRHQDWVFVLGATFSTYPLFMFLLPYLKDGWLSSIKLGIQGIPSLKSGRFTAICACACGQLS